MSGAQAVLQITAGRGPVEVRWFVSRLVPALTTILAARGRVVEAVTVQGEVDAPFSATLWVRGPGLAEAVADLCGTHCWVHASAQRGRRSRKRWFAGVAVFALPGRAPALRVEDVTWRTCRARGPGGQNVNKRSTAVQAVHGPTRLQVRAEGERSQSANRGAALARLTQAVAALGDEAAVAATQARRAAHDRLERGAAVRVWWGDPLV
jgi:peptide chain release factor 2/peptide chain release factor